jgi:4-amino-4-deoxy-L-arabinose transferase-like glycosyltransferase
MEPRKYILTLLLLWAVIYLAGAGYPPALLDDADTVHAEAAREMVQSGDWVTLHANRIRYLEKAPLMYWLIALSFKLFGVSEFTARLPLAVATLCLIMALFFLGQYAFGERVGFYAALMIATSAGIFLFTRVLWPDIVLTLFIALSFYCFLRATDPQDGRPRYYYGIYVFSALAVLTKGLIGAVFPAIIIGIYLLLTRQLGRLREAKLIAGGLLFLLIAAPWHLAVGFSNKGFFWFYFINEHFLRYVGKRYPADYDTVPLALFLGLHLAWLFPWSFFLPLTLRTIPQRLRKLDREERITLFLLVWIGVIVIFFAFSTTQEYYTMPTYPAFALLISRALALAEQDRREKNMPVRTMQIALTAFGFIVFAAGIAIIVLTRNIAVQGDISDMLRRNPRAYALSLGHILDLTPESFATLRIPVAGTALIFLVGTISALFFRLRKTHLASNVCLAIMMAGFFYCAHMSLSTFDPYLSSKALAESINNVYKEGEIIIINGEYEGGSSLNFYTRRMVYILNGRSANLEYGSYFEDAPKIFINDDDLAGMWDGSKRVYLFIDSSQLDHVSRMLRGAVYRLAESGGKVILTNRP